MESKRVTTNAYTFHICHRWQFDRVCCQKDHEFVIDRSRLVLGDRLFIACNIYLAGHGIDRKHSFWTIQIFFKLYKEAGAKIRVDQIGSREIRSQESGIRSQKLGTDFISFLPTRFQRQCIQSCSIVFRQQLFEITLLLFLYSL